MFLPFRALARNNTRLFFLFPLGFSKKQIAVKDIIVVGRTIDKKGGGRGEEKKEEEEEKERKHEHLAMKAIEKKLINIYRCS